MSSSILVELNKIGWPLLLSSSFLELDYQEETNHSEDCQTSLVPDPNMMPKLMMHHTTMSYRCSWLRLMVASAGEADRCSMKNRLSSISALCLLPQRQHPSLVHLGAVIYVGAILSHNWI
jgi:hypothetical protein